MTIRERLTALDWEGLARSLWEWGYARTPAVLTADECAGLIALYDEPQRFRSHIEMERYRLGVGDYKYFAAPLPPLVDDLRRHAYPPLAELANAWERALGRRRRHPPDLEGLLAACRRAGQVRPTPLLLRYEAGGYNCLHQDLYGDVVFPLQLTGFLSRPGVDYQGGEFLLVESRPRAQSRGTALTPAQGELVIFASSERPIAGRRGFFRGTTRHGVSRVLAGSRYTLGVIFHDAR